jgi:hypothetical protein
MSYTITKSNGQTLTTLSDGTVNTASSSLVLIGKNYAGYGTFLNDNFVRLLENFSSTSSPANPIAGQLWWDATNNVLKVYSGTSWKISTGATSSPFASPPGDLSALGGDLWFDSTNSQLKVYSGSAWITVGPAASSSVGNTQLLPTLMTDTSSGSHVVLQFIISGTIYAIFSKDQFNSTATGFGTIKAGLNFSSAYTLGLNTQDTAATNNTLVQRDSSAGITAAAITGTTVNATTVTATTLTGAFSGNLTGNVSATNLTASAITTAGITATSGYSGTILTASQPNITSVGTLAGLTVTGYATYNGFELATVGGSASFSSINNTPIGNATPSTGRFTTLTAGTSILPSANLVVNIGSSSSWFNNIYGKAIQAQYADLAERFHSDAEYPAGTVVELGGTAEITKVVDELSEKVFGVISTNAAYLMNSGAGNNATHPPIAMSGRVPVRAIGIINKGDRLVSAGNGLAKSGKKSELTPWNVIGRSLVTKTDESEGVIEAIVKINS